MGMGVQALGIMGMGMEGIIMMVWQALGIMRRRGMGGGAVFGWGGIGGVGLEHLLRCRRGSRVMRMKRRLRGDEGGVGAVSEKGLV